MARKVVYRTLPLVRIHHGEAVRQSYSAWRLCSVQGAKVNMHWFLAFPIICVVVAAFMWRFQRHLEKLTGPWISD
jgi:hypothetical protein